MFPLGARVLHHKTGLFGAVTGYAGSDVRVKWDGEEGEWHANVVDLERVGEVAPPPRMEVMSTDWKDASRKRVAETRRALRNSINAAQGDLMNYAHSVFAELRYQLEEVLDDIDQTIPED
jgi:hypothetical protein